MSNSLDATAPALDWLRGRSNPFDGLVRPQRPDERFSDLHVPALLRQPRDRLLAAIDRYRLDEYRFTADLPETRVVTVLGPRGAGKTHMLEALAHRDDGKPQLLVRPTSLVTETPYEDYLLDQLVNTLLAEDPVQGGKPFFDVAAQLTRRLLRQTIRGLGPTDRLFALIPPTRQRLWLWWRGGEKLTNRFTGLLADLADPTCSKELPALAAHHDLAPELLLRLVSAYAYREERPDDGPAVIRRELYLAMARTVLMRDGNAFGRFLEADYVLPNARPLFRADRVRQQLHALVEACALVRLPVIVALDNLEGALAPQGRFDADAARALMDNLAQAVDATRGLLFLLFAEKELFLQVRKNTNQFALDRIDQGVPLPGFGPLDVVELKPPDAGELKQLIAERVARQLRGFSGAPPTDPTFPFASAFLEDLTKRSGLGLRNVLLRLRDEYARVVYGRSTPDVPPPPPPPDWNYILERTWNEQLGHATHRLQEQVPASLRMPLHAGLGRMLRQLNGQLLADWELREVQPAVTGNEHPSYSLVSLLDWQAAGNNGSLPHLRVMVGLLLAGGSGMANDLRVKSEMFQDPRHQAEQLIIFWKHPAADDLVDALPPATRQVWDQKTRRRRAALRPLTDDDLRTLLAIPDWLEAIGARPEPAVPDNVLREFLAQRCHPLVQRLAPLEPERTVLHAN